MGGDEREEGGSGERHDGRGGDKEQTHPKHGAGKELLGPVAALLLANADEGGDEGLVHGLGDEIDEQAGDEGGCQEGVHDVGATVDAGDGDFFERRGDFDGDAYGANGDGRAQDAAVDAGVKREWGGLGSGGHR